MNAIVQAENLSRFYGMILGLNNVNFAIRPGITGVVGPNGAGKTTLFRLLTGQIRPSAGTLRVFGENPWSNPAVQARVAYCPEGEAVPSDVGARDWLIGLGMISGLSAADAKERAAQKLTQVKLGQEHWKKRLTALSKGMRQRVKLAQCLLHEPELVILDEPMNGLDPMGREDFGNVLRDLASQGRSVLISSHILHDLEVLCADFYFFDRLTEIIEGLDYELGGCANYNASLNVSINLPVTNGYIIPHISEQQYIQGGLVASPSKKFWDDYEEHSKNLADHLPLMENDILNILWYSGEYKTKVFEVDIDFNSENFKTYFNCSLLGRESGCSLKDGKVWLGDKQVKSYHVANGNSGRGTGKTGRKKKRMNQLFNKEICDWFENKVNL